VLQALRRDARRHTREEPPVSLDATLVAGTALAGLPPAAVHSVNLNRQSWAGEVKALPAGDYVYLLENRSSTDPLERLLKAGSTRVVAGAAEPPQRLKKYRTQARQDQELSLHLIRRADLPATVVLRGVQQDITSWTLKDVEQMVLREPLYDDNRRQRLPQDHEGDDSWRQADDTYHIRRKDTTDQ
jgi:hypothetical protein